MKKKILVAPLNWGIGHATRCIPIINWLIDFNFEPIIASDGEALQLLKKELPSLIFEELPGYNIEYSKKGADLKWKVLAQTPKILKAKKAEKKATELLVEKYRLDGIISDNRLGVRHKDIPSVYVTHQLNVLSGSTSKISSKMHQNVMSKFDEIWIPDFKNKPNLSGKLGHIKTKHNLNLKYIGAVSRLHKIETKTEYDLMVLLSGPEPQRTLLEKKLFEELKSYKGNILFIKGKIEDRQTVSKQNQFTICNFMTSEATENAINKSDIIICRSGYTTVMDLAKLGKPVFFIPTPGQFEQEYLAKHFDALQLAPFCSQDDFSVEKLKMLKDYKGLNLKYEYTNIEALFRLF